MHSFIVIALCLLCAGPSVAGTFQSYPSTPLTIQSAAVDAAPPVRVYGLEHQVPAGGSPLVGMDWKVNVSAPGRSSCDVVFWFLDRSGNTIRQAKQATRLDSDGFAIAQGTVRVSRASAEAVHELSAKVSCI